MSGIDLNDRKRLIIASTAIGLIAWLLVGGHIPVVALFALSLLFVVEYCYYVFIYGYAGNRWNNVVYCMRLIYILVTSIQVLSYVYGFYSAPLTFFCGFFVGEMIRIQVKGARKNARRVL